MITAVAFHGNEWYFQWGLTSKNTVAAVLYIVLELLALVLETFKPEQISRSYYNYGSNLEQLQCAKETLFEQDKFCMEGQGVVPQLF